MPAPLHLPEGVYKRSDGRWVRLCPSCSVEVDHLRRNYCVNAAIIEQPCKRCSVITSHPAGMVGPVRVSWYNSFYKSAISRGYCWTIDIEFVAALHEQQNGRCALSGLAIGWSDQKWDHTASIDRIDNSVGYTEENIQLVHKEVNMLRGTASVDRFIELCGLVADKHFS